MIVNLDDVVWGVAKKTKNIKAKPLISIMVDRSVLSKFLVDTLEGKEPLGDGAIICIGDSNDVWQQMPKKLLQKYNVIEIDNDGWMVCKPKSDNSVNCWEFTEDMPSYEKEFHVKTLWGEEIEGNFYQKGEKGDYICRSREDINDVWIVKRKIFINTYNIIS